MVIHSNAHALSRLLDEPDTEGPTSAAVGRISLSNKYPQEELRQGQLDDPIIGPILCGKQENDRPSDEAARVSQLTIDAFCNCGISQLASIIIEEQLLFQHFENDECSSHHTQLVVPRSLRDQVLQDLHGGALSGHFREDKTLGRLRERFYWPGFHTDVTLWCQSCKDCARQKMATPKRRAHLKNVQVWSPMQVVAVDILGPLPKSSNGKLIHPCNW